MSARCLWCRAIGRALRHAHTFSDTNTHSIKHLRSNACVCICAELYTTKKLITHEKQRMDEEIYSGFEG